MSSEQGRCYLRTGSSSCPFWSCSLHPRHESLSSCLSLPLERSSSQRNTFIQEKVTFSLLLPHISAFQGYLSALALPGEGASEKVRLRTALFPGGGSGLLSLRTALFPGGGSGPLSLPALPVFISSCICIWRRGRCAGSGEALGKAWSSKLFDPDLSVLLRLLGWACSQVSSCFVHSLSSLECSQQCSLCGSAPLSALLPLS